MNHETEIVIDAPRSEVWTHLIDFARHSEWSSTFTLDGRPELGAHARVGFKLLGRAWSHPVVIEAVEHERKLQWSGGPRGLLMGSHYFLLEPLGGDRDRTRFRHGEDFQGLAVPLVWPLLVRAMGPEYARFNQELKERAESSQSVV